MTQKIVINKCFGGFGLSDDAIDLYKILTGTPSVKDVYDWAIPRDDAILIQIVEQLGERANSRYGELAIVEIPDDVEWHIHEYDGMEHIAENHRTWS